MSNWEKSHCNKQAQSSASIGATSTCSMSRKISWAHCEQTFRTFRPTSLSMLTPYTFGSETIRRIVQRCGCLRLPSLIRGPNTPLSMDTVPSPSMRWPKHSEPIWAMRSSSFGSWTFMDPMGTITSDFSRSQRLTWLLYQVPREARDWPGYYIEFLENPEIDMVARFAVGCLQILNGNSRTPSSTASIKTRWNRTFPGVFIGDFDISDFERGFYKMIEKKGGYNLNWNNNSFIAFVKNEQLKTAFLQQSLQDFSEIEWNKVIDMCLAEARKDKKRNRNSCQNWNSCRCE